MPHPQAKAHRIFELVEPIATVAFCEVTTEAFLALGMCNSRAGPGRAGPRRNEVVARDPFLSQRPGILFVNNPQKESV
ncbi:MAG: hypothetical protein ABJD68_20495 [Nakamurella sp.]